MKQEKLLPYLNDMPIAFCVMRVEIDQLGNPYDIIFTYVNKAHAKLEGTTQKTLIGTSFYNYFANGDSKWLDFYYRTAYEGILQNSIEYSPEIEKYLSISTYQPEYGYCGCVFQDITKQVGLEMQIEQSNERARLILQNTTDAVFTFDLETRTLFSDGDNIMSYNLFPTIYDFPYGLLSERLIEEDTIETLEELIQRLKAGENNVSMNIRIRLSKESKFSWHNITFSGYQEIYTDKRRIIGFLRNVDDVIRQRERLLLEAKTDALTGLFNVKAGRMLVESYLAVHYQNTEDNAFFMFDLDNFKRTNDSHGHDYGDNVLIEFAKVLRKAFRKDDIVFRLGGDEFAAFIGNICNMDSITRICKSLFFMLEGLVSAGLEIHTSCGIFIGTSHHSYLEYYKRADAALYDIKDIGKNAYKITRD